MLKSKKQSSTIDHWLTICIPALGDSGAALEKVRFARKEGFVGPIIVSINDAPLTGRDSWGAQFEQFGCKLYQHDHDKGLYGNFKFLLDMVETTHFMWIALDDLPPLRDLLIGAPFQEADLLIGAISPTEFSLNGFGEAYESVEPSSFFSSNVFQINPSYIFGVWRRDFVRRAWPKRPMDWLDTYLLLVVRVIGKVEVVTDVKPWVIGASGKPNHKVNGKFFNPLPWGMEVARFLAIYGLSNLYVEFLRVLAGKSRFALDDFRATKARALR